MLKVIAKNYIDLNHPDEILSFCREPAESSVGRRAVVMVYGDHTELMTMIEEWKSREDLDARLRHSSRIVPQRSKLMTPAAYMNQYEQII